MLLLIINYFYFYEIDIDEKWFREPNKLKSKRRRRKSDEIQPSPTIINKNSPDQIMFISAIGVPQFSPDRSQYFNGKIGIYPLATYYPAQRNSKYRDKGTPVLKPKNVDSDVFYDYLTIIIATAKKVIFNFFIIYSLL